MAKYSSIYIELAMKINKYIVKKWRYLGRGVELLLIIIFWGSSYAS